MAKPIIQPATITSYGAFLSVILSKKSRPGDGSRGRGVRVFFDDN